MSHTQKFTIKAPDDPEVNIKVREELEYYITFPSFFDKFKNYGLVFCIPGYGERADSGYQINKLCPYIADKYNMLVVGVRYQNDLRFKPNMAIDIPGICRFYDVNSDYFKDLNLNQIIDALQDLIISKKLFSLESKLAIKQEAYHGYSSFGFMPAIDHLNVLFDIMKNYNIDKQNIIAFGTSYGGYIASLMAKYAPNTFSLVIDNSGFCKSQLIEVFGNQLGGASGAFVKYVDNRRYEIPFATDTIWSLDETSEYYFSDAHRQIRSLLIEEHRTPSQTMYCCYHSINDALEPIYLKDKMYKILNKYNDTYYKRVEDKDIDGVLFKNLNHGMNASLRKMFDFSINEYCKVENVKEKVTDFDMDITYGFPCLNKLYNFTFNYNGLNVEICNLTY